MFGVGLPPGAGAAFPGGVFAGACVPEAARSSSVPFAFFSGCAAGGGGVSAFAVSAASSAGASVPPSALASALSAALLPQPTAPEPSIAAAIKAHHAFGRFIVCHPRARISEISRRTSLIVRAKISPMLINQSKDYD